MDPLIPQPEGIGYDKIPIRQHTGLQAVAPSLPPYHFREVRADRNHLYAPLIKLGPKFFQSPQLGDTVGSPVRTEELDQHRRAMKAIRVEALALIVDGGEAGDGVSHPDGVRCVLTAYRHSKRQERTNDDCDYGRHAAKPTRAKYEGTDPKGCREEEDGDEQRPVLRDAHLIDLPNPQGDCYRGDRECD